jgi:hypothetical protein
MQLLGQLQNPPPSLGVVFEAFPEGTTPNEGEAAALMPPPMRLGNGVVQRAVVKVLAAAEQPMRVAEIRIAVEAAFGHTVSYESVSWSLRAGSRGDDPHFERTSYWCYRLRCQ